jgi:hypothetical protein
MGAGVREPARALRSDRTVQPTSPTEILGVPMKSSHVAVWSARSAGVALSLLLLSATPVAAIVIGGGVTSGGGSFVLLTPPFGGSTPVNTVGNNTFQTLNLYAFNEVQNVVAPAGGLAVDDLAGPAGAGTIAAGTLVASHYVFFDPLNPANQAGWVDFDSKILGVITSRDLLIASDILVNPGVSYLSPTLRGLEPQDSATIDGSLNYRLRVDWSASSPGDYVRVLTERSPGAPVPEAAPTGLLLEA